MGTKNPHAHVVLVPFPAQGHVTAMMRLGKLLHSRGFYITFVNTEFNHARLILSKGPESVKGLSDFKFETIPDGLPENDARTDIPMLCDTVRKTCFEPFKQLLSKLNSTTNEPPVSCIVSDGVSSFGVGVARDFGIPGVQFWSASVCSFIGFLHYREVVERGISPFKNDNYLTDGTLNTPVDWITGMSDICLKDLPSFIRTTDPNDILFDFMLEQTQNCLKASAIIFNTFDELEKEALDAVISKFNYPNIYTIGPLPLLGKYVNETYVLDSHLWKPDSKALKWLDGREPESVLYVNYGSITTMTAQHFLEFAWGLARSNQPFLWIIRPDVVQGDAILPKEFLEEIKDRGFLGSWCAQDQVLAHKAVGAFLTHCGWNSIIETICGGVPVICWPFFADQQTNSHYCCTKWGFGVEINNDVKRDEVAKNVKDVIEGENGKKMRAKAQEWKKKAEAATDIGGVSYINFEKFIKECLHYEN